MLGILLGTDDGLLELIPGSDPTRAVEGVPVTSLDYRAGMAIAGSPQGAWVHAGRKWQRASLDGTVTVVRVASDGTLYAGLDPGGLAVSADKGETWADIEGVRNVVKHQSGGPMGPRRVAVSAIAFPKEGVLLGIRGVGAWHSRDDGRSWLRRSDGLDPQVHGIWEHPEQGDRLFASSPSGIYRSEDAGFSWVQALGGLDRSWGGSVAIMPGAPDSVLFAVARHEPGTDGAFFRSPNGGVTWKRLMLDEEDEWDALPVVARVWDSEDTAFVAAGDKVWGTHDAGRNWIELARGLPTVRAMAPAL